MAKEIRWLLAGLLLPLVWLSPYLSASSSPAPRVKPKLVVLIVVDGLGQDQLKVHQRELSAKGLGRFLEKGAWFENAFYGHAATFTAVGHAAISTGAHPYRHGIIGNDWLDPQAGLKVYCVSDPESPVLSENRSRAVSPRNLKVSTVGDQLRLTSGGKSKVVAVATKDRSAILTAGHLGTAYFFSSESGRFVTSRYYMERFPDWWERYYSSNPQDRWYELWRKETSSTGGAVETSQPPSRPSYTPIGEEPISYGYILEFAKAAVQGEKLGENVGQSDLLILGLSAHDYTNHDFGPESPESLDSLLKVDRAVADLFDFLGKKYGLDEVVVALTGDHGFSRRPETWNERDQGVGRIDAARMTGFLNARLSEEFGEGNYVRAWIVPGVYLNSSLLAEKGISRTRLEEVAREALRQFPGVDEAYSRTQLEYGKLPRNELGGLLANSWRPDYGPDLWVVQHSGWYLLDEPDGNAATHGSPYSYDRNVPLLFLGPWFVPGRYGETVGVIDLAPTLAFLMGVPVPTAAEGRVLVEALER